MEQTTRTRSPATSFIVRVWSDGESATQVRGEVEHVRTGEKRFFIGYASLTGLIESWRTDSARVVLPPPVRFTDVSSSSSPTVRDGRPSSPFEP